MGLAVFNSNVDQLGIFGLLGGGKNEGGVGGGILRLVFADCCGILVICSQIEGGGELDSRGDGKEVVLAAGYVHAKSPIAQELDSGHEIRIRIKLTRVTDNSLCNHTALASLFSLQGGAFTRGLPSYNHRLNRYSSPVSPPGTGKRLTVPEALSCSKEFDMIAIAGWVSQSTMLWLWDCLGLECGGRGRDFG